MTDRLYYNDPYLREFDATVRGVSGRGDRLVVTLDRTAFYPTSGGQPFDTGTLGPFRVVDVLDENGGTIEHLIEPPLAGADPRVGPGRTHGSAPAPGETIHGVIDWERRFDHMQQHTGQHLLSAAFDKLFRVRTLSFHLGAAVSTIDLAREMTPAEIVAAETEANRIVWENRPVGIRYVTADQASALPLRKEPVRGGTLRLIDVDGFDLSACGGTHVSSTGAIGLIAVGSWERFKGGQRIEFLCGGRALARCRSLRDTVSAGIRLLSVLPEALPASIERLQAEVKAQQRSFAALQTELAKYRAEELAASAETVRLKPPFDLAQGGPETLEGPDATETSGTGTTGAGTSTPTEPGHVRLVLRDIDADANGLKSLAVAIAAQPGYIVVLVSTTKPVLVVVARSVDVAAVAANDIVKSLTATFGGRGGGKPELAQGGGLDADAHTILAAARDAIVSA